MADPEDIDESPTERKPCTLSALTIQRLNKLAKKGHYGTSVPKVMSNLIEEGIRRAIKDGFLKHDD